MPVPVVASFTQDTTNGTTLTFSQPTGIASGDVCVIIVGNEAGATQQWDDVTNKPPGFDFVKEVGDNVSDAHIAMFLRVIDGTESWPISVTAAESFDSGGWCLRVTGADSTTTPHQVGADYITSGSGSHPITGVTTTANDCLCLYGLSFDGGDGRPFSVSGTGWTESSEINQGSGANSWSGCFGSRDLVTAGDSGTATVSSDAVDGAAGFQIAIAPPAGSTGITASSAFTLDALTASSSASVAISADGAFTLDNAALAAQGGVDIAGDVSIALEDVTLGGTASVDVAADGAVVLGALLLDSTVSLATPGVSATAEFTFAPATLSSNTLVSVSGASNIVLGELLLTSGVRADVTAASNIALEAVVLGSGVSVGISATATPLFGALSLVASASISAPGGIRADASIVLGELLVDSSGTVVWGDLSASANISFDNLTVEGVGSVDLSAASDFVLGQLTLGASAGVEALAVFATQFSPIVVESSGRAYLVLPELGENSIFRIGAQDTTIRVPGAQDTTIRVPGVDNTIRVT